MRETFILLLALKVEETALSFGMWGASLEVRKGKGVNYLLEPSDRNEALLTP